MCMVVRYDEFNYEPPKLPDTYTNSTVILYTYTSPVSGGGGGGGGGGGYVFLSIGQLMSHTKSYYETYCCGATRTQGFSDKAPHATVSVATVTKADWQL